MTDRIYYSDPYCSVFEASVTRAFTLDGRPALLLDRTAFYPTSGGQPHDVGELGGVPVVDVVDLDDGTVAHVLGADPSACSAALGEGARVPGAIDWRRRFDHMQQHTGQHVLSSAFDRLFGNRTTSFHMSADVSTIDLATESPPDAIAAAEDEANRIVWEDRSVSIRFVSSEEAASLALRKEPVRGGTLRLIDISEFDLSACGGTHVARTGAIGIIAVSACERFRGGTRVTFACGGRALRLFRSYRDSVTGSIRALSVLPDELPSAIERVQNDAKDLRRAVRTLQESLAAHEGARLVAEAPCVVGRNFSTGESNASSSEAAADRSGVRLVVRALEGWDANGLKAIASAATAGEPAAVALVSATAPAIVVVATSKGAGVDAQAVLKQLVQQFGGRGGGKRDLAQGGGLEGDVTRIVDAARALLEQQLAGAQPRA